MGDQKRVLIKPQPLGRRISIREYDHLHDQPFNEEDQLHGCLNGVHHDQQTKSFSTPHWTYEGENGPDHWGDLCNEYSLSKTGLEQSPVNLDLTVVHDEELTMDLNVNYHAASGSILNNGHTIQVNWTAGSLFLDGLEYLLAQFHFHTNSEHTSNGEYHPLEVHFVHKNEAHNALAVIGVFFNYAEDNKPNPFLAQLEGHLPTQAFTEGQTPIDIGLIQPLLTIHGNYFTYHGSLTTPPCSEGVHWVVMKHVEHASKEQIDAYKAIIVNNSRPVQPLHTRELHLYRHHHEHGTEHHHHKDHEDFEHDNEKRKNIKS